jgi:hypothetical protein
MSVEMGIKNKCTGEYRVVPVSTAQGFREHWIPASKAIGLQMVQHLHDGTFTTIRLEEIPPIVAELQRLRAFVLDKPDAAWIADRVDRIVAAFETTDPAEYEYDFG